MKELISEIAIYLGIAALLGFFLGYLVWGMGRRRRIEAARAEAAARARTSVDGNSPLRGQVEALTRERDRLENRVEVLSAEVASLAAARDATEGTAGVAEDLGTISVRVGDASDAAMEAAAAAFPRPAEDARGGVSIFSADDDGPDMDKDLDLTRGLEEDGPARPFFRREDAAAGSDAGPAAASGSGDRDEASVAPDGDTEKEQGATDAAGPDSAFVRRRRLFDTGNVKRDGPAQAGFPDGDNDPAQAAEGGEAPGDAGTAPDLPETEVTAPSGEAPEKQDDLTRIKGIGKATETALRARGILRLSQLAELSDQDARKLGKEIGGLSDRILTGRWREQAGKLIEADGEGPKDG